ncbi:uncharacterized protein RCO7_04299 [Rhynchosporium graminicola]|uniref:Uncharacterized protein n=1 Tax=Rhynchosporium graminicola TaxID=2792576 RepID=A0A1E1L7K1_9HELO|nr:uncharacterized protein RCO7_04299 [Rhynchosporium commune]
MTSSIEASAQGAACESTSCELGHTNEAGIFISGDEVRLARAEAEEKARLALLGPEMTCVAACKAPAECTCGLGYTNEEGEWISGDLVRAGLAPPQVSGTTN